MRQHPGRTSKIQVGRSTLTFQTEVYGEPAEVVTLVDLAGRVVQTKKTAIPESVLAGGEEALVRFAGVTHERIETEARAALRRRAERGRSKPEAQTELPGEGPVQGSDGVVDETAAWLFMAAVDAYAHGDLHTSEDLFVVVSELLPDDRRVAQCLAVFKG